MLNSTLAYMDKIENLILFNKNKFGESENILLVADNENLSSSIEFIFTSPEPDIKLFNYFAAIMSLAIATHPFDSLMKKKLLLKRFLSKDEENCVGKINYAKIKNKNLVVFACESWFALPDENKDHEYNNLPPEERPDKKEAIINYAFEKESGNFLYTMSEINLGKNGFTIKKNNYIDKAEFFTIFDPSLREPSFEILNDIGFPKKMKEALLIKNFAENIL